MKRQFFKKGSMSPEFYKKIVKGCKKFKKLKVCDSESCVGCPFRIKPYCLMNIIINEFECYGEKERKTVRKKFIDCTKEEIENIITDMPDDLDDIDETKSGKEIVKIIEKYFNKFKEMEVEIVVDDEEWKNGN